MTKTMTETSTKTVKKMEMEMMIVEAPPRPRPGDIYIRNTVSRGHKPLKVTEWVMVHSERGGDGGIEREKKASVRVSDDCRSLPTHSTPPTADSQTYSIDIRGLRVNGCTR